jgi:hypothetical protein
VPLTDAGRAAVDTMMTTIDLADNTTTQLLSGPDGSGKTTELYRLKCKLERASFHVEIFDIGAYIQVSAPIDVTEFLIALALGAHDVLGVPETKRGPGFASRLRRLLKRLKISVEVPGLSTRLSREGLKVGTMGASLDVELKRELKSSASVVSELRSKLTNHIGRLYEEVAAFLATLLPDDSGGGSVLIVDGLDALGGKTIEEDRTVQKSVQALFVAHASKLKFSSHHLIYTVPTYLQFTAPGEIPYDSRMKVPVPRIHPRPGRPADTVATTIAELRMIVSRRIPVDRIFADTRQLDMIIHASGGHLRDPTIILRRPFAR